jgi:hypothetical protein
MECFGIVYGSTKGFVSYGALPHLVLCPARHPLHLPCGFVTPRAGHRHLHARSHTLPSRKYGTSRCRGWDVVVSSPAVSLLLLHALLLADGLLFVSFFPCCRLISEANSVLSNLFSRKHQLRELLGQVCDVPHPCHCRHHAVWVDPSHLART